MYIIYKENNVQDALSRLQYLSRISVHHVKEIIHILISQYKIVLNVLLKRYTTKYQNNVSVHLRKNILMINNVLHVSIQNFLTFQIKHVNIVLINKFMMLNFKNVYHVQQSSLFS